MQWIDVVLVMDRIVVNYVVQSNLCVSHKMLAWEEERSIIVGDAMYFLLWIQLMVVLQMEVTQFSGHIAFIGWGAEVMISAEMVELYQVDDAFNDPMSVWWWYPQ